MPTLDLNAIAARCDAATPGPWYIHTPDDDLCMTTVVVTTSPIEPEMGTDEQTNDHASVVAITLYQAPRIVCHEAGLWEEDAAFLAAARQDVPVLIAEVRRLRGLLDDARSVVTLIAQPDASVPPDLPDDAIEYLELTIGDVRAARRWLEANRV